MRYNPFKEMTDQELVDIHPVYQEWNDTGFIPEKSVLAKIRDTYFQQFGGSSVLIMERDYLRECTMRFVISKTKTNEKENEIDQLLDNLYYARIDYEDYVNREDYIQWSEKGQQDAFVKYSAIKDRIFDILT